MAVTAVGSKTVVLFLLVQDFLLLSLSVGGLCSFSLIVSSMDKNI